MKFQISNFKSQILHKGTIILVLLLAAFLRLYRIQDYMTFLGDEGRDVLVAYNILHGHLTLLRTDFFGWRILLRPNLLLFYGAIPFVVQLQSCWSCSNGGAFWYCHRLVNLSVL